MVDKSGNVKGYITEKELSKALTKSQADILTKSKTNVGAIVYKIKKS